MSIRHGIRLLLALLCVAAAQSAPARADLRGGNGEFGFAFGGTQLDDDVGGTANRFDARVGYLFASAFEIEGQVIVSGKAQAELDAALANLVFNIHPRKNLIPYVAIGGGAARLDVDGVGDDTSGAGQLAIGSRFFGPGGAWGLRVEGSLIVEDTFGESSTHAAFTFGFTFRIGKERIRGAR